MNIIYLNAFMFILSILMNPASIGFSANPLSFLSPGSKSLLLLGATGTNPHRPVSSLVVGPERQLSARKHSAHTFQHDGLVANRPAYSPGIWQLQDVFDFHAERGRRLSGVLLGRSPFYHRSFGRHLRSYRRGALFREKQGRAIRANGLSAGRRLGHRNFRIWFPDPGINNWAHGGGLLCGVLTGFLLGYQERNQENFYHKLLGLICVLATLGTLIWAVGLSLVILLYSRVS